MLCEKDFPMKRYGISVRLVEEDDAEFILKLRTNRKLSRYLHKTDADIEKQIQWIRNYKKRELEGTEYYFLFYNDLQKIGVSYIFAGEKNINLKVALKKLKDLFGIDKILCEGGPKTNEILLKENLVGKLIIVKLPVIGQPGALPIFGEANLSQWTLESFKSLSDGHTLVLFYKSIKESK